MPRMPDLVGFAQRHGLKVGTIEEMIAYRLKHDRIVKETVVTRLESVYGGDFDMHVYENMVDSVEHLALVKGDLTKPGPVLVRVHAVSLATDQLGIGTNGARGSLIQKSMELISTEGRGIVVLLRDLRPRSVSDWISKRANTAKTTRVEERKMVEIGVGSQILRDLGVKEMTLLTNQPQSRYIGLEGYGLKIIGTRRID